MTLQKITIINDEKYVSRAASSQSEDSSKDPKPKTASFSQNKNRKLSEKNKRFIKNKIEV